MSLIKRMRRQKAVLWSRVAGADQFGVISFQPPVEIACRWDAQDGQVPNKEGDMTAASDTVYVDRDVQIGDKLKLGPLETDTPDDPSEDRAAFEVQGVETIPNLRAKEFLRIAHL